MRLFIALEVPESWREAAARAAGQLVQASGAPLRLVRPEAMHLTLRFLGEVDEAQADALQEALASEVLPFDLPLALAGGGTFGPPARAQVAWLGLSGDVEGLLDVALRIKAAVTAVGLPREDRPLSPHLTLARVPREATPAQRRAVAAAAAQIEAPGLPFHAREIALIRSHLGRGVPRYEVLARYPEPRPAL